MTKEDMIRKLTSRKFWVCLIGFVTALLTAFNLPEASISQVTSIIMAFGSLIVYILAEGATDTARAKTEAETSMLLGDYSDGED